MSLCEYCREADITEAECTVGVCGCTECDAVAESVRAVTPDDIFWRAVERVRGN